MPFTYEMADGTITLLINCNSVTIKRVENGETLTFTSRYVYDKSGNITQSTDNAGNVTTYTYDTDGNRLTSTDAKGRTIRYAYDDLGNMTRTTYPDGTTESFAYDANGNTTTATDRNGLVCTMEYDPLDRLTQKTYADGTSVSYAYDKAGNLIKETTSAGAVTEYTYNNRNLNTAIKDTYGAVTTFAYDSLARLVKTTDNAGNEIKYTYDNNGNITRTTYADNTCVESAYDARNRVISQTDAEGNTTAYEYDGADRLTRVTDAYGSSYTYAYDGNGNFVSVTDPAGNVTSYAYDAVGHVSRVTNALGKTMEYTYDSTGNTTSIKDFAGNVTEYTYDNMNRITEKKVSGEKKADGENKTDIEKTTYTYDKDNLVKVSDKTGETTYTYDKYGRLLTKTDAKNNRIAYTYDKQGRISAITVCGNKTTYEYDQTSRVTRVIDHNGKATVYEYDTLGNRSAVKYANGTTLTYTYDACQRLKEECLTDAGGKQLAKYTYALGKNGERTKVTELSEDGTKTETGYTYDKLLRLTKEVITCGGSKLTNEYTYDTRSNRTEKVTTVTGDISKIADVKSEESTSGTTGNGAGQNDNAQTGTNIATGNGTASDAVTGDSFTAEITEGKTTYEYNVLNQLISETSAEGTTTYTYDSNGNLVKQTGAKTITYVYDKENHLLSATVQKGNSVTIEAYAYDYAGNRTAKAVNEKGWTYYVIDESSGLAQVVAELQGAKSDAGSSTESGIKTETGTETGAKQSAESSTNSGTKPASEYVVTAIYTLNGSERISVDRDGTTSTYFMDGHGNVRGLTDEEGNVTDTYSYEAYGSILKAQGTTVNDFLYTGEQYNAGTGLYYLRARYMNPQTGTFISMDSYQGDTYDPVSLHKYLYANANPVMNTDPTGYFSISEMSISTSIQSTLSAIHNCVKLQKFIKVANIVCTVYDVAMEIRNVILGEATVGDVIWALLKGVLVGTMVNGIMCKIPVLGFVLKPMMALFGLSGQVEQIQGAIENGDPIEISVRFVELICMLFGLTSQCFTGDTLVATENGLTRIDELEVGDYVWTNYSADSIETIKEKLGL